MWTSRVAVLRRSARTVKGGRRFSFGALVVVGNSSGRIGLGWGKSRDLGTALLKAERTAVAQQVLVPLNGGRISHEVSGQYCGAKVLLWPASPGTGIVASKAVRDVLECAGVKDVTNSGSLDTLARVQFMLRKTSEAIATEEKAANLERDQRRDALEKTLASYRQGKLPQADE